MSGEPSGSGASTPNAPGPSKAIGNLAKRPSDTTRQGAQKLKFVPTLPQKKKKAPEVVKEEPAAPVAVPSDRGPGKFRGGDGRGRGQGQGRGRGRGDGGRPPAEMTASGPFALGPALAGRSGSNVRVPPRSNFAAVPTSAPAPSTIGQRAPGLKKEHSENADVKGKGKAKDADDDAEVYSDQDDGVEIIDMDNVKTMDWMAPESLQKEKKKKKKVKTIKVKEDPARSDKTDEPVVEMDVDQAVATGEVDLANAIDLSESEEEEEMEDIIEDFSHNSFDMTIDGAQERLYLFQFPKPFPEFLPPALGDGGGEDDSSSSPKPAAKKVSFTPDTKATSSEASGPEKADEEQDKALVDGAIGTLEIYESGAVKMRLANDILLDVTAATQPSFLQQVAQVDLTQERLVVLGEISKRFTVSPDVDHLLRAMEFADQKPSSSLEGGDGLIRMDES